MKDKVCETPVQNLTQLKRRVTQAVRSLTQEMLQNVWQTLENRLYAIIRENKGHIEQF